ncbi:MAG TPA: hypothetical protein VIJ09_10710 [Acidimicrobiales bacterium]
MIDDEVVLVLDHAPEFTDRYLELVEAADGDPGAPATFVELADYVAGLATALEQFRPALVHCLDAIEKVAQSSENAEELVVWSFFENLSPDDLRRLDLWLGPHTRSLLDEADHSPDS